jgi:hypothetical protein
MAPPPEMRRLHLVDCKLTSGVVTFLQVAIAGLIHLVLLLDILSNDIIRNITAIRNEISAAPLEEIVYG